MSRSWTHEKRMSNISQVNWESKALATTLSGTEPEIKSDDSDDEGILNAFTATIDLFTKNNLQVHRIVTNSKVFLENECRTHRD